MMLLSNQFKSNALRAFGENGETHRFPKICNDLTNISLQILGNQMSAKG